jgi:hypothetical protein
MNEHIFIRKAYSILYLIKLFQIHYRLISIDENGNIDSSNRRAHVLVSSTAFIRINCAPVFITGIRGMCLMIIILKHVLWSQLEEELYNGDFLMNNSTHHRSVYEQEELSANRTQMEWERLVWWTVVWLILSRLSKNGNPSVRLLIK